MSRPVRADVRNEYAYWLATPKRLRISLGLPATDTDFSEMKAVDSRTLRRWKEKEDFQALVAEYKAKFAAEGTNSAVSKVGVAIPTGKHKAPERVKASDDPVLEPGLTADEQKYLQVKDTLIQMAMDGNQGAMDLYLKHYGKSFVDAEQAEFADYRDMSDEDLVSELCMWAGVDAVSGWLAEQAAAEL